MDAPVTVMQVTPRVCQNAGMIRDVATDMKTRIGGRNKWGRWRKSGAEKEGREESGGEVRKAGGKGGEDGEG